MTKKIILNAVKRKDENGQASQIRASEQVPAVLYGGKTKNELLKLSVNDINQAYGFAGESSLIDLSVDKVEPIKVIIKNIQIDPVSEKIIHVDFYRVDMKKPIDVEIPLEFIGEPKAVKDLGGTLMKNMESISAKCLPGDLLEKIVVDISHLDTFNDSVKVSDLKIDEKIQVMSNPDDSVAGVLAPRLLDAEEEKEEAEKAEKEAEEAEEEEKKDDGSKGEGKEKEEKKDDGK